MTLKNKIASIFGLILTLGLFYCGSDGTTTGGLPFCDISSTSCNLSGFYVVSSSPNHEAVYVSTDTTVISVRMSEAVNPASVAGQIELIKVTNGMSTNVTGSYGTPVVNGQLITLTANVVAGTQVKLSANSDYEIHVFPGLTSVAGNQFGTFLSQYNAPYLIIDFSTGNGGTSGEGVAGAPTVQKIDRSPMGSCFGSVVTFSEAIPSNPVAFIKYTSISAGIIPKAIWVPASVMPASAGSLIYWRADLDPMFCSDMLIGTNITVRVDEAVDMEGLSATNLPFQKTFSGI